MRIYSPSSSDLLTVCRGAETAHHLISYFRNETAEPFFDYSHQTQ
jgi:hypothetical protein